MWTKSSIEDLYAAAVDLEITFFLLPGSTELFNCAPLERQEKGGGSGGQEGRQQRQQGRQDGQGKGQGQRSEGCGLWHEEQGEQE